MLLVLIKVSARLVTTLLADLDAVICVRCSLTNPSAVLLPAVVLEREVTSRILEILIFAAPSASL